MVSATQPFASPSVPALPRALVPALALCCGVTVANVYLGQPLLGLISATMRVTAGQAGLVATFSQLGYSLGLLFLLPLGDSVRRRPLLTWLVIGTVAGLVAAMAAPGLPALLAALMAASAFTIVPQLLIPLATAMVAPERRGRVVAVLQAGLFSGVLVARVAAGALGELSGWRTAFAAAAVCTAVAGGITIALLPGEAAPTGPRSSYAALLLSLPGLLREPVLRRAIVLQMLVFGVFNMLWTTLVFLLTSAPYTFDAATAGLFGLFGAAGVVVGLLAGRAVDTFGTTPVAGAGVAVVAAGAGLFTLGQNGVVMVALGIAVLYGGLQACQIANQSAVFAARPDARSRMNTVYMFATFLAGAGASALGAALYGGFGWPGVSGAALALAVVAVGVWALFAAADRRRG